MARSGRVRLNLRDSWGFYAVWVVLALVHLWSLMHFPMVTEDEGWLGSRAWAFLKTGHPFGPLDAGVLDRFKGYWTFFPWLHSCIQAIAMSFLPWPSLFALRFLSLLVGFVLLFSVYQIGKRWYGPRTGLIAVLLTGSSWSFFLAAHYARIDVMTAAFGYGALALLLYSGRFPFFLNLLSGLCVGLAFEIHPYGSLFGPALLAVHIAKAHRHFFKSRQSLGFLSGAVLGLFFFFILHLWRYPQTYFALAKLTFGPTHVPPLLRWDLKALLLELLQNIIIVRNVFDTAFWLVVVAFYLLLKRRLRADVLLVVFLISFWTAYTLAVTNKIFFYIILWNPGINLLLAPLLAESLEERAPKAPLFPLRWTHPLRCAVWAFVGAHIMLQIPQIQVSLYKNYTAVQEELHQVIQPNDRIMASQSFWFGLHDHEYYSWEQLVFYHRYKPDSSLEEAMDQFRPDIFIIDGHVAAFISEEGGYNLYARYLRLPKAELEAFLGRHAQLVKAFADPAYGIVYVWRISWDKNA